MNYQNQQQSSSSSRKRHIPNNNEDDGDNQSINSEWTINDLNNDSTTILNDSTSTLLDGKNIGQWKIEAVEARSQMWEAKYEYQMVNNQLNETAKILCSLDEQHQKAQKEIAELKLNNQKLAQNAAHQLATEKELRAKIHALTEENKYKSLKLKEKEIKPDPMANKQQLDEAAKKLSSLHEEHQKAQKKIEELMLKNLKLTEKNSAFEGKQRMFETTIHRNQQKMEGLVNEMRTDMRGKMEAAMKQKRNLVKNKQYVNVNPRVNRWKESRYTDAHVIVSSDGAELEIISISSKNKNNTLQQQWRNIFAVHGFSVLREHHQINNNFAQSTVYGYFEVTEMSSYEWAFYVGMSSQFLPDGHTSLPLIETSPNYYTHPSNINHCWLSGKKHEFEWPNGTPKPKLNAKNNVVGCGLLLDAQNKQFVFFTENGTFMGKEPLSISPSVDQLYPTIGAYDNISLKANFGGDGAKPFIFNFHKCAQLGLE